MMKKIIFSIIIFGSHVDIICQKGEWPDALNSLKNFVYEIHIDILKTNIENLEKYCINSCPRVDFRNEKKCRKAIEAFKFHKKILQKNVLMVESLYDDLLNKLNETDIQKYIGNHNRSFFMTRRI